MLNEAAREANAKENVEGMEGAKKKPIVAESGPIPKTASVTTETKPRMTSTGESESIRTKQKEPDIAEKFVKQKAIEKPEKMETEWS